MIDCPRCGRPHPDDALFCMYDGKPLAPQPKKVRRGNGTGSVVKRPDGRWQTTVTVGYYMEDGKRRRKTASKTFVKRADALAACFTLKGTRPASDETLDQLHDLYLAGKDYAALSASQRDKLSYAWRRWEPLRFRSIASITVDELQRTVDSAAETYYPARDMKVMISHLYSIALKQEIVTRNKADDIDLPPSPHAKREVWTAEDIAVFWKDYEDGNLFTGYILIMCYCGLRYGELATIRLENIHTEDRYMIGGIKTEAGIDRTIPIAARILPVIERFYNHRRELLLEICEDSFRAYYWQTIDRLGLRRLPPQTGRHYYFTALTAAGVQPGIITETGGHASYLTTMKNYVNIPLSDKLAAVDQI